MLLDYSCLTALEIHYHRIKKSADCLRMVGEWDPCYEYQNLCRHCHYSYIRHVKTSFRNRIFNKCVCLLLYQPIFDLGLYPLRGLPAVCRPFRPHTGAGTD